MIRRYFHQTRQKVHLKTNAYFIHERYNECSNECSCQRDHTLSSGTREGTLLDTCAHCFYKVLANKEDAYRK